jgi:hypothetical protein
MIEHNHYIDHRFACQGKVPGSSRYLARHRHRPGVRVRTNARRSLRGRTVAGPFVRRQTRGPFPIRRYTVFHLASPRLTAHRWRASGLLSGASRGFATGSSWAAGRRLGRTPDRPRWSPLCCLCRGRISQQEDWREAVSLRGNGENLAPPNVFAAPPAQPHTGGSLRRRQRFSRPLTTALRTRHRSPG